MALSSRRGSPGPQPDRRIHNPWIQAVASFLTVGIWYLVWYYRLNRDLDELHVATSGASKTAVDAAQSTLAVSPIGSILIIPPWITEFRSFKRIARAERFFGIEQRCDPRLGIALFAFGLVFFPIEIIYAQRHVNRVWLAHAEARPKAGTDGALLELRGLSMAFGGLKVIDDLDLVVKEREIVSVIGPNGAGKTTLFNVITGIYRPDGGEILLDGASLYGLAPHAITKRGVARTFQTLRLFLNMSVIENVIASQYGLTRAGVVRAMLRTPGMRREEREIRARAEKQLSFFGQRLMGYRWDQPAYSLSYANRRRLEIARAMATGPKILLLDEPAAGMNPVETHEMTELIARLRDEGGYTILVIEHDMHVVEGISDRVIALDHGVKIAEGSFEQVATDARVVEAYLGTTATAAK